MSAPKTPPGFNEYPSSIRWPKRKTGDIGIVIPQPSKLPKTLFVPRRKKDLYSILRRYGGFTQQGANTLTTKVLDYIKKPTTNQFKTGKFITKPYYKADRENYSRGYPTHVSLVL
jgi:hypothetical protein